MLGERGRGGDVKCCRGHKKHSAGQTAPAERETDLTIQIDDIRIGQMLPDLLSISSIFVFIFISYFQHLQFFIALWFKVDHWE